MYHNFLYPNPPGNPLPLVIHLPAFIKKRREQREFLNDLENPDNCITQIDFAQAYQCELQKETMGALWRRGTVNLFTCAVYHERETFFFFFFLIGIHSMQG